MLPGGASDDGVLAPSVAAGVSAAVESAIMGAGEASGVEAGLDTGEGRAGASWGNCDSAWGESLRTAVRLFVGLVDIFANTLGPATWSRDGVGDGCRRW